MRRNIEIKIKKAFMLLKSFLFSRKDYRYSRLIADSGIFDRKYYLNTYQNVNALFRWIPIRHYVVFGEPAGFRPNSEFSPRAYAKNNPDVVAAGIPPLKHFIEIGAAEGRFTKELASDFSEEGASFPFINPDRGKRRAPYAVVLHLYYHEMWGEFLSVLSETNIEFDLFVTLTQKGNSTEELKERIIRDFPDSRVYIMPNRGRDILPFISLVNSGVLDQYSAVCKLHSKRSPHRNDGEEWRQHLVKGILPGSSTGKLLRNFMQNRDAAVWVADGQFYRGSRWWGSNLHLTQRLLQRIELQVEPAKLCFPAGSIYWLKPFVVGMLKSLAIKPTDFEGEDAQVDGTVAHAVERSIGLLVEAAGLRVAESSELLNSKGSKEPQLPQPRFVSAFYLPQFHPIPENDEWWGKGFTEWRSVVNARPKFDGHLQPLLPADLGYYDLRVVDVLAEQARLAKKAGINAFCVYHYWFDRKRVLETPLKNLLSTASVEFPFYLCWANESWRRNWDGLSGTVLLEQSYADGFEQALATDTAVYFADERYSRPDGTRPRFVIYRPGDIPNAVDSIRKLRAAWKNEGFPDVELGAVRFHLEEDMEEYANEIDFWVEMPPHGMVSASDYLYGGVRNDPNLQVETSFAGLIYDYQKLIERTADAEYVSKLPANTIAGVMPSWDNTARRGNAAHIAYGANPATFRRWLQVALRQRVTSSYRQEIFINAWNEWAEKAVLEPDQTFGDLKLKILESLLRVDEHTA